MAQRLSAAQCRLDGAVMPRICGLPLQKELCASHHHPSSMVSQAAVCSQAATLEQAGNGVQQPVEEVVAVSKHSSSFSSLSMQFQLELSETTFGHSKLSELLQLDQIASVREVCLDSDAYSVMLRIDEASAPLTIVDPDKGETNEEMQRASWPSPICVDFDYMEMLGPYAPPPKHERDGQNALSPQAQDDSYLLELLPLCLQDSPRVNESTQQARPFCIDEPLELASIEWGHSSPAFGKTPSIFSPPLAGPPCGDETYCITSPPLRMDDSLHFGFYLIEPQGLQDACIDGQRWGMTSSLEGCTLEATVLNLFLDALLTPSISALQESVSLHEICRLPARNNQTPTVSPPRCSDSLHYSLLVEAAPSILCSADKFVF